MMRLAVAIAPVVFSALLSSGCAGMIAGSQGWFEGRRADVEPTASTDLGCDKKPLEFVPVSMDDYREIEARGCGKKVRYKFTKVAFVEKWVKSSEVSPI